MKKILLASLIMICFAFGTQKQFQTLSEGEAYKMLYENQVKANDNILKTIIYALSGLGTATLLVFASNWWFNDKKVKDAMNEIDTKIKNAKNEILGELSEKINELSNKKITEMSQTQVKLKEDFNNIVADLNDKFNNFTIVIRGELKDDNKSTFSNYQNLLKSYNENLTQQIKGQRDLIEEKTNNLSEKLSNAESKFDNKINSNSKLMKRNLLMHEAEIAVLKGNFNISLKAYLDLLEYEIENDYLWNINHTIGKIITCLNTVVFIYNDELESLKKIESIIDEDYKIKIEEIKAIYEPKEVRQLNIVTS